MTLLVSITMFGWIPVVIGLFSRLKSRHAVISAILIAWLFLPMATYQLPGIPDYTKMSATCWGVIIGALLFDHKRLFSFRPQLIDLPMVLWCLCPIASSISNELGIYDGLATVFRYTVTWGFPYFIGRIYFNSLKGLDQFALGILIGGLVYIPLCLYEGRMSPQLHRLAYGFMQHEFGQTYRWGGYRPMVFMQHGLMVGVWMMCATLTCFWFWATGNLKKLGPIPLVLLLIALLFTTVMTRSTGALALLAAGIVILFAVKKSKSKAVVVCLILVPVLYMSTRATGIWDGYNLQEFIANNISYDRALSLWTRMENENILAEKALEKPTFGWGGWGRSRVTNEEGEDISVTDGLWIITLGENGLAGLGLFSLSLLLPIVNLLRRYPTKDWTHPRVASAAVLSILLGLYMVDNLLNAMINPIFTVIAGGLAGITRERLDEGDISASTSKELTHGNLSPRFI